MSSTNLHFDIQDAGLALLGDVLDRLDAGSVEIAPELGMLDESALVHDALEVLPGDEMVFAAVLLARSRAPGRVRDGEAEAVRVFLEEPAQQSRLAGARGARDDDGRDLVRG